jgi:hypothetical protein
MTIGKSVGEFLAGATGGSDPVVVNGVGATIGNISIVMTATGTVNLERSFDKGVTWVVVKIYSTSIEEGLMMHESNLYYRLNVVANTGDITTRVSY